MKNISIILTICVFLLGCKENHTINQISQQDIEFVNLLKNQNKQLYIESIDSVLNIHLKDDAKSALLHFKKGVLLSQLNQNEEALKSLNLALPFFEKTQNKKYLLETYWHMGSANAFLYNIATANKQLLTALQYSKETNNRKIEAKIYGSLAHTQFLSKDYITSIEYTKKSIAIYTDLDFTLGLSSAYNNLAIIYKNMGDYRNALLYNTKALEINILKKDTIAMVQSYNNIGNVYARQQESEKAINSFQKAIELNNKKNVQKSSPYISIGDLYLKIKNIDKAKTNYSKALNIEYQRNNIPIKLDLTNRLLEITLQKRDFENAIFYQKQSDSLNALQALKNEQENIILLKDQYQLAASKQNLKIEQQINKKNKIIFLVAIGFLMLLVLLWFQNVRNKMMNIEKNKILLEQKFLRSQMNPHFIFNALSSIQNSLLDGNPIKSVKYLSSFARLIRQNFDFIQEQTISLSDELDALQNYLDTQKMRFEQKFDYIINLDPNIDIYKNKIPPLLLQPFVENSIEHGFKNKKEKGKITIDISEMENYIQYQITDNGKRFDTKKIDNKEHAIKIFKKRLKLIGNKDEKTFTIESNDKGTTIKFRLIQ